nr:hypothetical protein [Tanacetum cinerariifolium]
MARLQFCDYHNMVAILEKSEYNVDFHPIVDFVEASPLRIETTDEGTKIHATVDGILRTVLNHLLGEILSFNMRKKSGQFSHQWKYLIHTIMQCLSPKSTGFNEFSSNSATSLVCLATNRTYNFSKMIFDGLVKNVNNKVSKFLMYPMFLTMCLRMSQFGQITHSHTYVVPFHTRKLFTTLRVNSPSFSGRIVPLFDTMLVQQGEGSGIPTEPHHTPFFEAQPPSHTTHSSLTLPPVTTTFIPTVTPSDSTPIRQYTRRARIAQSSTLPPVADEPASPLRDVSQGEAFPTDSGFIADQDRETISKSSTLAHDSASRVTSSAADEGSMQQTINELMALCTSLQRQYSDLDVKFEAQEIEITRLKARVKLLEDREGVAIEGSGDDAPIKGRNLDKWEAATERASNDTKEMATVLTSMDAATVLASGAAEVPTGSGSIPTAGPPAAEVPTGSEVVPTVNPIFATDTESTQYKIRKGKEVMVESETPKKQKVQDQIDAQVAIELEEQLERKDQRKSEQIARDAEVARIHIEKELFKRKWISFEQESVKKQKTSEELPEEVKYPDEVPEEKVKEMMQLVPIEEVYVKALQVKHPIIYWKNLMHAPVEWKLYDACGVHHVTAKDKEIFMLVEKDYPLRKGQERFGFSDDILQVAGGELLKDGK